MRHTQAPIMSLGYFGNHERGMAWANQAIANAQRIHGSSLLTERTCTDRQRDSIIAWQHLLVSPINN
jgi:hypothetical protein